MNHINSKCHKHVWAKMCWSVKDGLSHPIYIVNVPFSLSAIHVLLKLWCRLPYFGDIDGSLWKRNKKKKLVELLQKIEAFENSPAKKKVHFSPWNTQSSFCAVSGGTTLLQTEGSGVWSGIWKKEMAPWNRTRYSDNRVIWQPSGCFWC